MLIGEYNEKRDQRYLSFRLISLVLYSVRLYNVTEVPAAGSLTFSPLELLTYRTVAML